MGRVASFLVLLAFASLIGCGGTDVPSDARPILIREAAGTVDGVGLGDRPQMVIDRLGQPAPSSESDKVVPFRAPEDLTNDPPYGHHDVQAPGAPVLRYDDTLYLVCPQHSPCPGRVSLVMVTGAGAVTSRGVRIGDSLGHAEEEYRLYCRDEEEADEGRTIGPYCTGKVAVKRFIMFVGDPIDSIQIMLGPT